VTVIPKGLHHGIRVPWAYAVHTTGALGTGHVNSNSIRVRAL